MATFVVCYNVKCKHNYRAWCSLKKIEISASNNPICVTYLESQTKDKEA